VEYENPEHRRPERYGNQHQNGYGHQTSQPFGQENPFLDDPLQDNTPSEWRRTPLRDEMPLEWQYNPLQNNNIPFSEWKQQHQHSLRTGYPQFTPTPSATPEFNTADPSPHTSASEARSPEQSQPETTPQTPETVAENPFGVPLEKLQQQVGSAHDPEERRATTIANQPSTSTPTNGSPTPATASRTPAIPEMPGLAQHRGTGLSQDLKTEFSPKAQGQSLDEIQVIQSLEHVDFLGAKAFTVGNKIVTGNQTSQEVLRHEVGHIVDRKLGNDSAPHKIRRWATNDTWAAEQERRRRAEAERKRREAEARRKAEIERKRAELLKKRAEEAVRKRAALLAQRKAEAQRRREAERRAAQRQQELVQARKNLPPEQKERLQKVQQSQQNSQAIWKDMLPDQKSEKVARDGKRSLPEQWLNTGQSLLGKGDAKGLENYFGENRQTIEALERIVNPEAFSAQRFNEQQRAKGYREYLAPTGNSQDKVQLMALRKDSFEELINPDSPEGKKINFSGEQVVRAVTRTDGQGKSVTEYFVKAAPDESAQGKENAAQWIRITPPKLDQVMVSVDATELTQGKQPKELNSTVNISGGESHTKKRYNSIAQNEQSYQAYINPTFTQYQQLRGNTPRQLGGSNLRNEIGMAMNFMPNNAPQSEVEKKALKDGKWDLFSGDRLSPELAQNLTPQQQEKLKEQLKRQQENITKVEGKIKEIGEDNAKVTTLPIIVDSPDLGGVMQRPLFRVTGKDGKDRFVDDTGRVYENFQDWKDNNKLPAGRVSYFADGQITGNKDGKPNIVTEKTYAVKDTAWEHVKPWLDGAAIVGGIALMGAAIVFSGGAATPAVLAAAMTWGGAGLAAYGLANGGSTLYDRASHGESLSLADEEARAAWLEVAGSAAGFAAIGTSMRAMSAVSQSAGSMDEIARAARLQQTAQGVNRLSDATDVVGLGDSTYGLAKNWDKLSPEQRLMAIGQIGFWGGMMGAGHLRGNALNQQQQNIPEAQVESLYGGAAVDEFMASYASEQEAGMPQEKQRKGAIEQNQQEIEQLRSEWQQRKGQKAESPKAEKTDKGNETTLQDILVREQKAGEREPSLEELIEQYKVLSAQKKEPKVESRSDSQLDKPLFCSDSDPLRETYGSARESHPEEYQQSLEELTREGVDISFREGNLGYSPAKNSPGRFIFDPDASVGALRHEMRHFRDIRDAGYPGLGPYLEEPKLFWEMEYRAYMEEVNFARSQGDYANARKILQIMRNRKKEILGEE
jgi:hypothetical protein